MSNSLSGIKQASTAMAKEFDQVSTTAVQRRRVVLAGSIGSVVEFFDFAVYGYVATTIAALFFPKESPTAGLLSTLAIFAVAYVVRPIGGILFGHFGDRYGRKPALAVSVIAMALGTFLIGILPTHQTIGDAAPLLLVLIRVLQGLSAGGEIGGASAMLAETSRDENRGLLTSTTQIGSLIGLLLASAIVALTNLAVSKEQFAEWAWRIPFLLALPTGLVGLYIRSKLEEAALFKQVEKSGELAQVPVIEVLRTSFKSVMKAFGIATVDFAGFYIVFIYVTIYLQTIGKMSRIQATWSSSVTLLISALALGLFAHLSDRLGRRPIIAASCIGFIVLTLPMFKLLQGDNLLLAALAQIVLGLCVACIMGPLWTTLAEMFHTRVRYTGMSLGFNLAAVFIGGISPYIATWLTVVTGDKSSPAYFLMATAVVTLLTVLTVQETSGKPLQK
jgi:MHS family proline/betaine transporter-like MFS transporter